MTLSADIIKKFSAYPAFKYRDVKIYFNNKKNIARTLSYLKSSGKVHCIVKGVYTTKNDLAVTGFAFEPFYYGLLYALTIKELWTQMAKPEAITLKRVKKTNVKIFNNSDTIILHHSKPKYFFGFDIIKYNGINIPVSTPEKTLIDLFFYQKKLPIQEYDGLLKSINTKKLNQYLKKYDNHTKTTVTNFIKKNIKQAKKGKLENPY